MPLPTFTAYTTVALVSTAASVTYLQLYNLNATKKFYVNRVWLIMSGSTASASSAAVHEIRLHKFTYLTQTVGATTMPAISHDTNDTGASVPAQTTDMNLNTKPTTPIPSSVAVALFGTASTYTLSSGTTNLITAGLFPGMLLTSSASIAANTRILTVDSSSQITVNNANLGTPVTTASITFNNEPIKKMFITTSIMSSAAARYENLLGIPMFGQMFDSGYSDTFIQPITLSQNEGLFIGSAPPATTGGPISIDVGIEFYYN